MRSFAWALLLCLVLLLTSGREPERRVINVSTAEELAAVLSKPLHDVTIRLASGRYSLSPIPQRVDSLLCEDPGRLMDVTVGLIVSGRNVRLLGTDPGAVVIVSESDYRLYFNDCDGCAVERVAILTSLLDHRSGAGSGILATGSSVLVRDCMVVDEPPGHGGDGGVIGAKSARLDVQFNEIRGQGVGICVYSGARAVIRNNLIVGELSSKTRLPTAGVGVYVGCDAEAIVEHNLFQTLVEGVQLRGRASFNFKANIVEDVFVRGVDAIDDELGRVRLEKNVIYRCGQAGIAMRANGDQMATRNIIVETSGTIDERAIQLFGSKADAAARKNTLYSNGEPGDVPREAFWRARRPWTRTYRNTPVGVDGRHKFHESAFLTRYGRWLN